MLYSTPVEILFLNNIFSSLRSRCKILSCFNSLRPSANYLKMHKVYSSVKCLISLIVLYIFPPSINSVTRITQSSSSKISKSYKKAYFPLRIFNNSISFLIFSFKIKSNKKKKKFFLINLYNSFCCLFKFCINFSCVKLLINSVLNFMNFCKCSFFFIFL